MEVKRGETNQIVFADNFERTLFSQSIFLRAFNAMTGSEVLDFETAHVLGSTMQQRDYPHIPVTAARQLYVYADSLESHTRDMNESTLEVARDMITTLRCEGMHEELADATVEHFS